MILVDCMTLDYCTCCSFTLFNDRYIFSCVFAIQAGVMVQVYFPCMYEVLFIVNTGIFSRVDAVTC